MRSLKNQSGSVIVFVTLVVVLLLVMVGMGLDTGWLTFSRSVGQRAVDMAALAGAAGVAAGNPAKVKANVEALNSTNDYVAATGNQINGTVNDKNVTVSAVAVIESQPALPIALNGCCGPDQNGNLPPGCTSNWVNTNTEIPWNQAPSGGSNPNNSGWTTYFDRSVSSPDVIALIDKIAACQGTGGANVGENICINNGQQNPDLRELEILIGTNADGTPK